MVELMKMKTVNLKAQHSDNIEVKGQQKLGRLREIEQEMLAQFEEQKLYETEH